MPANLVFFSSRAANAWWTNSCPPRERAASTTASKTGRLVEASPSHVFRDRETSSFFKLNLNSYCLCLTSPFSGRKIRGKSVPPQSPAQSHTRYLRQLFKRRDYYGYRTSPCIKHG